MSNARSPREVCSTTIGTSGLIVLASFASSAGFLPNVATAVRRPGGIQRTYECSSAARRPQLAAPGLGALLVRRPQLVAGFRLLDRDRFCLADQHLDGLTTRDLLAHARQAVPFAQLLEYLRGRRASPLRRRLERLAHFIVARLDPFGL